MKAYIEHHREKWGWGCSIFNNDTDFDPVGIGEWYYLAGKDKPNFPMPAIPTDIDFFYHPLQPFNTHIAIYRRRYRKRLVIWYQD